MTAWLLEVLLETSGSIFAFRRRLWLLSYLLGWRVLIDIVSFGVMCRFGKHEAYAWVWLIGQIGQYALMLILGCRIAAKLLREYQNIEMHIWLAGFAVAGATVIAWIKGDGMLDKWLD